MRRAEKDGVAIEFPEYVDGTAEEAKNTVCRVSLSEEDLPFGEVSASHCGPLNREPPALINPTTGIAGCYARAASGHAAAAPPISLMKSRISSSCQYVAAQSSGRGCLILIKHFPTLLWL